jgi:hypothetical protein
MQEIKTRLEFLLVDLNSLKQLVFSKTEEELRKEGNSEKYYRFCSIEASLISAKNHAEFFLAKYGENTQEDKR